MADSMLAMAPEERSKTYSFLQIMDVVAKERSDGNKYFKQQEFKLAAKSYDRGCKLLEELQMSNDDEENQQQCILQKLYCNKGQCYIKASFPKRACLALQDCLKIDFKGNRTLHVKAYYRLGLAKRMLCNYQDARLQFLRARELDKSNTEVGAALADLDKLIKREQDNERALCQRMFNTNMVSRPAAAPAQPRSDPNITLQDEIIAEILDQMDAIKRDNSQKEFPLPPGFDSDEIQLIRRLCIQNELRLVQGKQKGTFKIVKM